MFVIPLSLVTVNDKTISVVKKYVFTRHSGRDV